MPKWARRTKSLDALLPVLYLRGISAGNFQEVLTALLGKDVPNLSPAVIARLKGEWEDEYQQWQKRDLSARRYVYVWADGVYLQARMTGRLTPKPGGGRRHAKLDPHRAFLLARVAEKDDITMPELAAELMAATGTRADPASISRWLIRNGYRFKKNAAGQRTRSARRQASTRGVDGHAATKNAA